MVEKMTNHEERKRELAEKATPGPRYAVPAECSGVWPTDKWKGKRNFTLSPEAYVDGWEVDGGVSRYMIPEHDARLAAFHCPETALLEAEVIAALRRVLPAISKFEVFLPLEQALAALDAHFTVRENNGSGEEKDGK